MGDCIMAFWNAPVENLKHAELAVEAAQKMMKTIYRVNDIISTQGNVSFDLRIGIGVATGECVVEHGLKAKIRLYCLRRCSESCFTFRRTD